MLANLKISYMSIIQMAQTMQIPLDYAEDIIGVQGTNIDYIRRSSGAILTVQESRGLPEQITVEIKGSTSQVQAAQQLIQVDTFNLVFYVIFCCLYHFSTLSELRQLVMFLNGLILKCILLEAQCLF